MSSSWDRPAAHVAAGGAGILGAPQGGKDSKEVAAEAATRINAFLKQKGTSHESSAPSRRLVEEYEVNSSPARFPLTRGETHRSLSSRTGCAVCVRGTFHAPGAPRGADDERPLYLRIEGDTREAIDVCLAAIKEIEAQHTGGGGRGGDGSGGGRGGRPELECRVPLGLEVQQTSAQFNLPAKAVGPQGQYVKWIESTSRARVQLRGRDSGFKHGNDQFAPIHFYIRANNNVDLESAKKHAEDLITRVMEEFHSSPANRAQLAPPPPPGPPSHHQLPYQQQQTQPYGQQQQYPPPHPPPPNYRQLPPQDQQQQQQHSFGHVPPPPQPPGHQPLYGQQQQQQQQPQQYQQPPQPYHNVDPYSQPPPPPPPPRQIGRASCRERV
eukprot:TRINITY_DN7467_c0_g1_i1.p1 TRINITY_DN7467_c0_g1~~TRINITY_DN7467_c0_g1_i1.p1  ORF type:complete len:382 (-),score=68.97 TRINITY_DN7467_c0_g1_i1:55-1200(-)